jgi:hypothetical protein
MAVTLTSVRTKSDIDINGWRPKLDLCGYVRSWITIKIRYSLTYDPDEAKAITDYSRLCRIGDIPVQALPGYTYQSNQPTPTPTSTAVGNFSADSSFRGRSPSDGDEGISSYVSCTLARPFEYQAVNSFISIFDPVGNLLDRRRLSDMYNPYLNPVGPQYSLNFKEMLKNSGKTYSCLFDVVRLDGSQVTQELSVRVPSIIKSPLPIPQTEIYAIASGGNYEVGCFLTNWEDYSLGQWKYISAEAGSTFEETSKVSLIRDDGSIYRTSGFALSRSWPSFFLLPWDRGQSYVGLFVDQQRMYIEIDRAAGKRYTCKYEMVGFNGETLVHTEIVQMPTRYVPPTPTPSPIPTVTPGAFCAAAGAIGKSANGTSYTCKTSETDTRYRWR